MHPHFLFPRNGDPIPPARDTDGSVASVLAPFDEGQSWVYIAESQSKSEPGTPLENDDTACSDTEETKPCTRWAQRWERIESRL